MTTSNTSAANREFRDFKDPYSKDIQQATTVATRARNLDKALGVILGACSDCLGLLFPSFVLLDTSKGHVVGRMITTPQASVMLRRIAGRLRMPLGVPARPPAFIVISNLASAKGGCGDEDGDNQRNHC